MISWISRMLSIGGEPDDARVIAFGIFFLMVYLAIHGHWTAQDFGIGVGAYAASIGGWLRLRGNN